MATLELVRTPDEAVDLVEDEQVERDFTVVRHNRRRRVVRWISTITMCAVALAFLGLVVFHTVIIQQQRSVDESRIGLNVLVEENIRLELELAQLEAPDRIVTAARSLGMVEAPQVIYLAPPSEELGDQALVDAVGTVGVES